MVDERNIEAALAAETASVSSGPDLWQKIRQATASTEPAQPVTLPLWERLKLGRRLEVIAACVVFVALMGMAALKTMSSPPTHAGGDKQLQVSIELRTGETSALIAPGETATFPARTLTATLHFPAPVDTRSGQVKIEPATWQVVPSATHTPQDNTYEFILHPGGDASGKVTITVDGVKWPNGKLVLAAPLVFYVQATESAAGDTMSRETAIVEASKRINTGTLEVKDAVLVEKFARTGRELTVWQVEFQTKDRHQLQTTLFLDALTGEVVWAEDSPRGGTRLANGLWSLPTRLNRPEVDRVLEAIADRDADALFKLVKMTKETCTTQRYATMGMPVCPDGLNDGSTVEVFLVGSCEPNYLYSPVNVRAMLDRFTQQHYVFAAYKADGASGGYGIIVSPGAKEVGAQFHIDSQGAIVGVTQCGGPNNMVPQQGVSFLLVPPYSEQE